MSHTIQGWSHVVAALVALFLGAPQFARQPGDRLHRRVGYAYLVAVGSCDVAALAVYHFTGHFNFLHIGALVNAVCLVRGVLPLYRRPHTPAGRVQHARWLLWSYVGLWAAGLTEFVVRTGVWSSRSQLVWVTVVITVAVTLIGRLAGLRVVAKARVLRCPADT